ncbi:MAG TPA: hypothetical protein VK002_12100 [Rubricoccaceae bacterium]|nr:hypothetical protein [Rubricoccaceae bacterium]
MHHIGPTGEATPFSARELAESLLTGPHYEPPYAGALQDEFAWHLVKYLREDARLESEVAVERPGAFFALDFLVEAPLPDGTLRRVAFECGGARTLRDGQRLLRRDATVLAAGAADAVYRLRGSDLLYHMEDVLYLVSQWEGEGAGSPFSERGRINLRTLASPQAKALRLRPEQASVLVTYPLALDDEAGGDGAFEAGERALWHAANDLDPFILLRRLDRRFPDVWAPYAEPGAERPAVPHRLVPIRKAS